MELDRRGGTEVGGEGGRGGVEGEGARGQGGGGVAWDVPD